MTLIDVHTHLDHPKFKRDMDQVIANAEKHNVNIVVTNGTNQESNTAVLDLAKKYNIVKAALGIHPEDYLFSLGLMKNAPFKIKPFNADEEIKRIENEKENIVAIGEIGLDDHWVKDKLDLQIPLLHKLCDLATKLGKPVLIHSRAAEQPCIEALESNSIKPNKVIMHCFGGNMKLIKQGADNGYNFSVPCNVVRSHSFQQLVKEVNINQLFTETDAPFLGPFKGKRNEPANIMFAVKKIAEIKQFNIEEVEDNILLNWKRVFG